MMLNLDLIPSFDQLLVLTAFEKFAVSLFENIYDIYSAE